MMNSAPTLMMRPNEARPRWRTRARELKPKIVVMQDRKMAGTMVV